MIQARSLAFAALALLPLAARPDDPASSAAPSAGTVVLLTGQGTAAAPAGSIRPLVKDAPVYSGEIVSTAANSYMNLGFSDGGFVLLRPDSRLHIRDYANAAVVPQSVAKTEKTPAQPKAAVFTRPSSPSCEAFDGQPVRLDGCAAGQSVQLPGVTFRDGSAWVNVRSRLELKKLAAEMKTHRQLNVEIDGYTDNRGNPESNRKLAEARAKSVRNYLVALGVAAARLSAKGLGPDDPIADNSTDEGRETNRRVEVRVLGGHGPSAKAPRLAAASPTAPPTSAPPPPTVATEPTTPAPAASPAPVASGPAPSPTAAPLVTAQPTPGDGSHAFLSLLKGGFRAVSGAIGKINHDDYQINTPVATIGIRGTNYLAVICDTQCANDPAIAALVGYIAAEGGLVAGDIAGGIVVTSSKGSIILGPGEYVLVEPDGTLIALPAIPRFLALSPIPDPAFCAAPG